MFSVLPFFVLGYTITIVQLSGRTRAARSIAVLIRKISVFTFTKTFNSPTLQLSNLLTFQLSNLPQFWVLLVAFAVALCFLSQIFFQGFGQVYAGLVGQADKYKQYIGQFIA